MFKYKESSSESVCFYARTWRTLFRKKLHRKGNPALVTVNGIQMWFEHGKLHREDGPAVIWADRTEEYHLRGKEYNFTTWLTRRNRSIKGVTNFLLKCV